MTGTRPVGVVRCAGAARCCVWARRALCIFALLAGQLATATAQAANELYSFASEEQRQRYYTLLDELRCPKCQNQSLSDSNAPIAADLRRELQDLLAEGYSDAEILDFMRQRYGEFVLYDPPLNSWTIALWLLPMLLLVGGVLVVLRLARRTSTQAPLPRRDSEEAQQQLEQLLREGDDD